MEITPSEIHFIMRTIIARIEWIKDNFNDDDSIEEGEQSNLESVFRKFSKLSFEIKKEAQK